MQMSKLLTKTKHTIRPVDKPTGKKSRFDKPTKIRHRQKPGTFNDLSLLKDKMEEMEMRMGGTTVNAAKIFKDAPQEKPDVIVKDQNHETEQTHAEHIESANVYKVSIFDALRLGVRDTLFGQAVTAVMGR